MIMAVPLLLTVPPGTIRGSNLLILITYKGMIQYVPCWNLISLLQAITWVSVGRGDNDFGFAVCGKLLADNLNYTEI